MPLQSVTSNLLPLCLPLPVPCASHLPPQKPWTPSPFLYLHPPFPCLPTMLLLFPWLPALPCCYPCFGTGRLHSCCGWGCALCLRQERGQSLPVRSRTSGGGTGRGGGRQRQVGAGAAEGRGRSAEVGASGMGEISNCGSSPGSPTAPYPIPR